MTRASWQATPTTVDRTLRFIVRHGGEIYNTATQIAAKLAQRPAEASARDIAANLEWNASQRLPILIFEEQRVPRWAPTRIHR